MNTTMDVKQVNEGDHKGAFIVERGGERLAEMTYTTSDGGPVIIDHTWVSDTLRGQGVGAKLLAAFVARAREAHWQVIPLCPYAKSVFDKDASIRDVLAP